VKGHLGFPCRPCLVPGPPTNLRQVGIGNAVYFLSGTLAWDAPESVGGGPITGYRVEIAVNSSNTSWQVVSNNEAWLRQATLSWCDGGVFRVFAINKCGAGQPAEFFNWTFASGSNVRLITASTTLTPPCWATSVKVWCVGNGGTFSEGGAGGGLAWKTWNRTPFQSWQTLTAYIQNAPIPGGLSPRASVTYGTESVVAFGASTVNAGYGSGGDGWVGGNSGSTGYGAYFGQAGGSITYPFTGAVQYSGNYTFGGGIGGTIGNNPDGTPQAPRPVSPCRRHPATSRSGLFDAVALLGMKVTEDCDAEPAFGSGGVAIPYSTYGSSAIYFAPGYGGGGFDSSCPGGPGCILVNYS